MRWAPTCSSARARSSRPGSPSSWTRARSSPTSATSNRWSATAPGHAMLSTGAYPWRTGIVANRVMNRTTGKEEPIFWDADAPGARGAARGGGRLARGAARRDAVGPPAAVHRRGAGRRSPCRERRARPSRSPGTLGQAFWFNEQVGRFVTGTCVHQGAARVAAGASTSAGSPTRRSARSGPCCCRARTTWARTTDPSRLPDYGMGRTFPHPLSGGAAGRRASSPTPRSPRPR